MNKHKFSILSLFLFILFIFTPFNSYAAPNWQAIDKLVEEQKFTAASKHVDVILKQAKATKDNDNWTRALVAGADYRIAQGKIETAVRFLQTQQWPQDKRSQVILNLYYADALSSYIQRFSWEIRQREHIKSSTKTDLKKQTLEQLLTTTNKAYRLAWKNQSAWPNASNEQLKRYFKEGNYPKRIRGTLRDTITYLWVDFIGNESLWSAKHSNQTDNIKLQQPHKSAKINPSNTAIHPLKRITWLLANLDKWHARQKRPEAALEALRVLVQRLYSSKKTSNDQQYLQQILRSRIQQNTALAWSNMARWTLAEMLKNTSKADRLIQSKKVLDQCIKLHSKSEGFKHCTTLREEILEPYTNLQAMKSDGLNKRSIAVTHKNIKTLYFRAWKVDLLQYLKQRNRDSFMTSLLSSKKIATNWSVNLPTSRDYLTHRTYVTPPMKQYGYWLVLSSDDPSFALETTNINAIATNLTRLTAEVHNKDKQLEVTVYQGETGQLAPNTTVELWAKNYPNLSRKLASVITGKDGRAVIPAKLNSDYAIVLKHRNDMALLNDIYHYDQPKAGHVKSSLIFTDRSIYRPNQKIQWKVVAYQGNPNNGNYRTSANSTGWVKLLDANGKVVIHKPVKTNHYGSASGEFEVKSGRMLGRWRIASSWQGNASIRVEEYKRPTFSAKLDDSKIALRLNKPMRLTGTARYYFGQSVTSGKVKWRVTRKAVFDWRYSWSRFGLPTNRNEETIATGSSMLDDKGQFKLGFLPKGNANYKGQHASHVSYVFNVSADITDSGGETRSAKRAYRLGLVSIKSTIQLDQAFGVEGQDYKVNISRLDLDDIPRSGNAHWTLNRLQQDKSPQLPAELNEVIATKSQTYATKGDKQKPRWATHRFDNSEQVKNWKKGQQVRKGTVSHAKDGKADINLKGLSAGIYRLHYTTFDSWKQRFEVQQDIVIASKQITPIPLATFLKTKTKSVEVGKNVQLLLGSGFKDLPVTLEVFHGETLLKRSMIRGGIKNLSFPVTKAHRGGLDFRLTAVKDYQILKQSQHVSVPWTDRTLNVAFSTFRDKLRPGQKETWRVTVKDAKGKPLELGSAEVLASMYDRSLDFFSKLRPANPLALYREKHHNNRSNNTQGIASLIWQQNRPRQTHNNDDKTFIATRLSSKHGQYGGGRMLMRARPRAALRQAAPAKNASGAVDVYALQRKLKASSYYTGSIEGKVSTDTRNALRKFMGESPIVDNNNSISPSPIKVRSNFNETAFFYPHLALEKDGSVSFEFEVPESLTEWKVWISAITRDLRSGSVSKHVRTSKELMVRPYLPRFLREGDRAEIEVVLNNMGEKALAGQLEFEIFNPDTNKSLATDFKLQNSKRAFNLQAGKSTNLRFALTTPHNPGMIAIRTKASAGNISDGEQRPLPILPSRLHLSQSRFVALQGKNTKTLQFKALAKRNDPTRINDKLVVNVEGQLFYSVLNALPYLSEYPYECTEQTLNRYLSTSIVKSVFDKHPAVATMAKKLSSRKTQYEQWDKNDPNRKMLLEETPWLTQAEGGSKDIEKLFRILDPTVANNQRQRALQKLRKSQAKSGGFPWWAGGPESPYMTMYLLHGFSRSLEFNSAVPKDMVQKAWRYLHKTYKKDLADITHTQNIVFINYLLSAYPDNSWSGGVFNAQDRKTMLDASFKRWTTLPALLKSYLALTLHRSGRQQDAKLVFDSIMDAAKSDPLLGTYWAPEDRAWLWYNDSVDTHAFILRTLSEIDPKNSHRQGIVQWLMLNKKLNHWKSTRATAESIYALVHYLKQEKQLGLEERATVKIGNTVQKNLIFKPDEYTGHKNQIVVEGEKIKSDMAKITVANDSKSLMFASATWHFSTEKPPKQAQGDFFHITRKFYKRVQQGKKWVLQPLVEGATVAVGDQLEVQLSLRSKHNAEYVQLRSPRAAGYEPVSNTSSYKWQTGIGYYEEIRDNGANYFFERLPAGEYSFKYRLRATTAGQFRTAPAVVQSVYAPEFVAYSAGTRLIVK